LVATLFISITYAPHRVLLPSVFVNFVLFGKIRQSSHGTYSKTFNYHYTLPGSKSDFLDLPFFLAIYDNRRMDFLVAIATVIKTLV
jgi:hypothetical protein